MPTYDYECEKCGHTFDEFQTMSDDPLTTCPSCGKESLKRLIGGGLGVIFKGSGFYVTDSRSGSKNGSAKKSESTTAASAGEGSSSGSDGAKSDGGSTSTSSSKSESASGGSSKGSSTAKVAG